jgi:hypothetical protein
MSNNTKLGQKPTREIFELRETPLLPSLDQFPLDLCVLRANSRWEDFG